MRASDLEEAQDLVAAYKKICTEIRDLKAAWNDPDRRMDISFCPSTMANEIEASTAEFPKLNTKLNLAVVTIIQEHLMTAMKLHASDIQDRLTTLGITWDERSLDSNPQDSSDE